MAQNWVDPKTRKARLADSCREKRAAVHGVERTDDGLIHVCGRQARHMQVFELEDRARPTEARMASPRVAQRVAETPRSRIAGRELPA